MTTTPYTFIQTFNAKVSQPEAWDAATATVDAAISRAISARDLAAAGVLKSMTAGLLLSANLNAFAAAGHTWKEEVLLHDGTKIIVERTLERGGRHEIGQLPPIKQQSLTFVFPNHNTVVTWDDPFTQDIGGANFLPMQLEVRGDAAYLVAHPMGCLSYNKWGRPNPPYVIFKYHAKAWQRIQLQDLPVEFSSPNLIFSSPDEEAMKTGQRIVSAQTIKSLYETYRQPEFRSILREPLPPGQANSSINCKEMVRYKCGWGAPGEFNRKYFESACK